MRPPRTRGRRQRTLAATAAWGALLGVLTCAAGAGSAPPDGAAPPAGALRVSLDFGPAADLDLYVTGPLQETVYFANTPSRIGGRLEADVRCDAPASGARTEVVLYAAPPPGRYRVGVDFPVRCRPFVDTASFTVRVEGAGLALQERGEATFGRFVPIALEFEILAPAQRRPDRAGRVERR